MATKYNIEWGKKYYPRLFFKDDEHVGRFVSYMAWTKVIGDVEYNCLFYALAALHDKDLRFIFREGTSSLTKSALTREMDKLSSGEKAIVKLALNLFNPRNKADVFGSFYNLDRDNLRVCMSVIAYRFRYRDFMDYPEDGIPRCKVCGYRAWISPRCGCGFEEQKRLREEQEDDINS